MNDVPELAEMKRKANTRSLKEMAMLLRYFYLFCVYRSKLTKECLIFGVTTMSLIRMPCLFRTNINLSFCFSPCYFSPSYVFLFSVNPRKQKQIQNYQVKVHLMVVKSSVIK